MLWVPASPIVNGDINGDCVLQQPCTFCQPHKAVLLSEALLFLNAHSYNLASNQITDVARLGAGPALMPGGTEEAYKHIEDIVRKVAAQVNDGPCVTYVGNGGAGNFVKMVHNGIEYGDMQLISEAYDILKTVGGFSNEELGEAFDEWNKVSCTPWSDSWSYSS